jgi:RNA polymerase sigma-70 factor (ECF subfamily)
MTDDHVQRPPIDWPSAMRQHERWLRTITLARLRSPEAVDEVMQEIALAAVRQAAPLADASKLAPWLYRLAVRQVLLYRRGCGRRRHMARRYATLLPTSCDVDQAANPLEWLLSDERRARVRLALEQLPPREAEILMLKYAEHWSYQQIARQLGVSLSTVESRLHRARQRMRGALLALDLTEVSP